MESDYPKGEIDKQRRRATELGVDDLICKVVFEEGLRYYASWSRNPLISEVRGTQRPSLGFTLKGRRYSIRTEENQSNPPSDPKITRIYLELFQDGNLVFAERIEQQKIGHLDVYSPQRVTAFVEGEWIEDFRDLAREMKRVARANLRRIKREPAQQGAANFGLALAKQLGSTLSALRRIWRTTVSDRHRS